MSIFCVDHNHTDRCVKVDGNPSCWDADRDDVSIRSDGDIIDHGESKAFLCSASINRYTVPSRQFQSCKHRVQRNGVSPCYATWPEMSGRTIC